MAEKRRRYPRLEQHWIFPRLRTRWIQPGHGAFASLSADGVGGFEILEVACAMPGVIALHRTALARNNSGRTAVPGDTVCARKAAGRCQSHGRSGGAGARAVGVRDSVDGKSGALRV